MKSHHKFILFLLFLLVFMTGCDDQSILKELAGKRLGIIIDTDLEEKPLIEIEISEYIKRRANVEVVTGQMLTGFGDYKERFTREYFFSKLGIDYLLVIKLSDYVYEENRPSLRFKQDNVDFKFTHSCSLALSYLLYDLSNEELYHLGQSTGYSEDSIRMGTGTEGLRLDLSRKDRSKLIIEATLNALRRTDLI